VLIVLDSGVLGHVITPRASGEAERCQTWFLAHLEAGTEFAVPEIIDYERRRGLLHAQKERYVRRLDSLIDSVLYLPLTTTTMRLAAELYAEALRKGIRTAPRGALDVDMILCAQVRGVGASRRPIVATSNVRHLTPFVAAAVWEAIEPETETL
jgi:predicted nucleic acid-binding protein